MRCRLAGSGQRCVHTVISVVLMLTRLRRAQIYGVARDLMKHHSQTHGIVMGGANRRTEAERLARWAAGGVCV